MKKYGHHASVYDPHECSCVAIVIYILLWQTLLTKHNDAAHVKIESHCMAANRGGGYIFLSTSANDNKTTKDKNSAARMRGSMYCPHQTRSNDNATEHLSLHKSPEKTGLISLQLATDLVNMETSLQFSLLGSPLYNSLPFSLSFSFSLTILDQKRRSRGLE
jgi:hypothetical protein